MVARRIDETSRYDYVPTELKQQKQWARYDTIDGRDKRPVNLDGSVMYWKKKPESKLTFNQVAHFDKIGCFATLESGIFKVDYDGCVDENGNIHPLVLSWIKNTYAEISPSRTGVKAWFKGTIPNGKAIIYNKDSKHFTEDVPWANPNNPHTGIEIYAQKRFFTVTGNKVPGCPSQINEAPDALHDMLTRFAPKPKEKKKTAPKENIKKSSREQDNFEAPDGYWSLKTWKSWCSQNLEIHNEGEDYLDITCPWAHSHTTPGDNARIYFGPPHTIHCFHAHCDGREWCDVRLKIDPAAYDWQYKQSRSVEQSIKHLPSYPEITMAEQEDQLVAAASAIEPAIRDHMEANDGTALVISYPQGTGKTHVTAQFVAREKENIITAWMSPTKEVAHSVPALKEIYHIQACNKHNCPDHKIANTTGEMGYNTMRSVHKYHECDWKEQPFEGETVVFNQQYYRSSYPASHDLVINDEATISDWLPERKVTIYKLQKVASYKDTDSEDYQFLRAIEDCINDAKYKKTPNHGKPIFDRLDKDSLLTNWLEVLSKKYANLRPKTNIDLNNDPDDELMHLLNKPEVLLPHLVKAFSEELEKWQSGKQWNSRIRIGRDSSGDYAMFITEPRQLLTDKDGNFPPFVHLDGCIDEEIHSKLFGRDLKVLRATINPAPGTEHAAIRDNNFYGITALTAIHKDGSPNKTLAATIKKAKYMLKKFNPDGSKKVALISHMDCVDEIAEALVIPQEQTGYYWNIRGSNSLEKCDILLLIGTPTLNPQTVATIARSLWFDDPEPICEDWTRENGYADLRMKRLAKFLTNSELTQAAHRVRPIRHENKTIISFCEGEIDFLPITETFTSLPYMTEEGENLHTTNKEAAYEKIRIAYEELSKDDNHPTTEEVRKLARVKRNTVVEWMKDNASQDVPNVNTQSIEEFVGTTRSMIIDYIDPRVLASNLPSDVPTGGQEPMINPDDIQRYHGIEKGAKVITPLGQGTVVLIRGIRPREVRVTVSVEKLGWKSFRSEEVKSFIQARQEPLPANAGIDALFAGIGG